MVELILDNSLVGRIIGDSYLVQEFIGAGGMGATYRAEQLNLKRRVCIKFLKKEILSGADNIKRFKREAKVLAGLDHPNIVQCFAFGLYDKVYPYLVMEFVEGQSLRSILNQGPLDWRRACSIISQVCEALSVAHKAGFIPRDIKPDNVMLTTSGGAEIVKLIDFGLVARNYGEAVGLETLTEPGSLMGSINYMPPESFAGARTDRLADIYAVGCVLHELVTGASPFSAASPIAVMQKHLCEQLSVLPSNIQPDDKRKELEEIIFTATSRDVSQRYNSCDELLDALAELLDETGESIHRKRPPRAREAPASSKTKMHKRFGRVTAQIVLALVLLSIPGLVVAFSNSKSIVSADSGKLMPDQLKIVSTLISMARRNHDKLQAASDDGAAPENANFIEQLRKFLYIDGVTLSLVTDASCAEQLKLLCKLTYDLLHRIPTTNKHYNDLQAAYVDLLTCCGWYGESYRLLGEPKLVQPNLKLTDRGNRTDLATLHEEVMAAFNDLASLHNPEHDALTARLLERLRPALPAVASLPDGNQKLAVALFAFTKYPVSNQWKPSLYEIASTVPVDAKTTIAMLTPLCALEVEVYKDEKTARLVATQLNELLKYCTEEQSLCLFNCWVKLKEYDKANSILLTGMAKAEKRGDYTAWCRYKLHQSLAYSARQMTREATQSLHELRDSRAWNQVMETVKNQPIIGPVLIHFSNIYTIAVNKAAIGLIQLHDDKAAKSEMLNLVKFLTICSPEADPQDEYAFSIVDCLEVCDHLNMYPETSGLCIKLASMRAAPHSVAAFAAPFETGKRAWLTGEKQRASAFFTKAVVVLSSMKAKDGVIYCEGTPSSEYFPLNVTWLQKEGQFGIADELARNIPEKCVHYANIFGN